MRFQPAGAAIVPLLLATAVMFAIITSPLTTPAGLEIVRGFPMATELEAAARNVGALPPELVLTVAVCGLRASRCVTPTPALVSVTVFWPVAPMASWIPSNIPACAIELVGVPPELPSFSSLMSVGMPPGTPVPKPVFPAPSAKEATIMVFAPCVVMLGVEREVLDVDVCDRPYCGCTTSPEECTDTSAGVIAKADWTTSPEECENPSPGVIVSVLPETVETVNIVASLPTLMELPAPMVQPDTTDSEVAPADAPAERVHWVPTVETVNIVASLPTLMESPAPMVQPDTAHSKVAPADAPAERVHWAVTSSGLLVSTL